MNDEAVGLLAQRIKESNLPQPITCGQAFGKTLKDIQGFDDMLVLVFSDDTLLFTQGHVWYDDAELEIIDWPESAPLYVYRYLERQRPEVAKQLREDIAEIEERERVGQQERYERETYERLKTKFESDKR